VLEDDRQNHPQERSRGSAGGNGLRGQDRLSISYLIQADRLRCIVMPEQIVSRHEDGEKKDKGLTPEQRRHLERSLKENDDLMKCLAKM
jgi:hypothetical protein